jgi:hypothetical protein
MRYAMPVPTFVKNCATLGSASTFSIHQLLKRAHLLGRRTFLGNENAASKTAVSDRQQGEWQMGEEKDKADNTAEQNRNCQPGAIQKFVQGPAVPAITRWMKSPVHFSIRARL